MRLTITDNAIRDSAREIHLEQLLERAREELRLLTQHLTDHGEWQRCSAYENITRYPRRTDRHATDTVMLYGILHTGEKGEPVFGVSQGSCLYRFEYNPHQPRLARQVKLHDFESSHTATIERNITELSDLIAAAQAVRQSDSNSHV